MHLISKVKGKVTQINHQDEMNEMESVKLIEIEPKVGDMVVETVNIRTDSGYVLLENIDPAVVQRDYNRILELQENLFEVEVENNNDNNDNSDNEELGSETEKEGAVEIESEQSEVEVEVEVEEEGVEKLEMTLDQISDEDVEVVQVEAEVEVEVEAVVQTKSSRRRKRNHDISDTESSFSMQQQYVRRQEHAQYLRQQLATKFTDRPEIVRLLKKVRSVTVRTIAILSGYFVATYTIAISLPLFYPK